MSDEQLTARAAELAERILDEVSSSHQDWRTIASWAGELAALGRHHAVPGQARAPVGRISESFRGLAHPTRLRIVEELRHGGALSPAQLAAQIEPPIALGNVAHHTRELRRMGLLSPAGAKPARGALEHFYRLSPHGREMLELADFVAASPHLPRRGRRRR
jgi:DNA-binding transcriptional ArsR family regulator